jgi:uncharacterized protein (DUF2237 family)
MDKNLFGEPLEVCGTNPKTGYFRDGCCNTGPADQGTHTVCAIMTQEFLKFTKLMGNDLSTPVPLYKFPGLKPGDRWCLCVLRWMEAYDAGIAPMIIPEATNEKTLDYIEMSEILKFAYKKGTQTS